MITKDRALEDAYYKKNADEKIFKNRSYFKPVRDLLSEGDRILTDLTWFPEKAKISKEYFDAGKKFVETTTSNSDQIIDRVGKVAGAAAGLYYGAGAGTFGAAVGTVGAISAISASGSVVGLSAAGITSGLAAIGGTMLGGLIVASSAIAVPAVIAAVVVGKVVSKSTNVVISGPFKHLYNQSWLYDTLIRLCNESIEMYKALNEEFHRTVINFESDKELSKIRMQERADGIAAINILLLGLIHDMLKDIGYSEESTSGQLDNLLEQRPLAIEDVLPDKTDDAKEDTEQTGEMSQENFEADDEASDNGEQ